MKFIQTSEEEYKIGDNSENKKRNNSEKIDYFNKMYDKPWGKEYLAFQNSQIGIWILHVKRDQETSLHCHFKKDTLLMPLSGSFKINLFHEYTLLNLLECLYIPKNTFHGIHAYAEDSILMEIEIYTEHIQYTDKNDLLRIKDIYNRDKNKYETSALERVPNENEIMHFHDSAKYVLGNTEIVILKLNRLDESLFKYEKLFLLEGCLYTNGAKITAGSSIDLKNDISFLTESITVFAVYNLHYKCMQKVIYSKSHLTDLLNLQKKDSCKIGLTCGCFDILHEGHIKNLKECKKNCDSLFVCLSSDEQIRQLKGITRPVNSLLDRINMLINFEFVDKVILYEEIDNVLEIELDNIMNIIEPYVWFKGSDYTKEDILKKHPSLKKIHLIHNVEGKSTTNIINKIKT